MFEENRFENVLKSLRVRPGKGWTQAKTAESLGVSLRTYTAWEIGESLPTRQDLHHLAALQKLWAMSNKLTVLYSKIFNIILNNT